jgi:glc operon protein GlcG
MTTSQPRPTLLFGFVLLLAAPSALAQAPLSPPPQTPYGSPIASPEAKRIAAAAVAEAQRNKAGAAVLH